MYWLKAWVEPQWSWIAHKKELLRWKEKQGKTLTACCLLECAGQDKDAPKGNNFHCDQKGWKRSWLEDNFMSQPQTTFMTTKSTQTHTKWPSWLNIEDKMIKVDHKCHQKAWKFLFRCKWSLHKDSKAILHGCVIPYDSSVWRQMFFRR